MKKTARELIDAAREAGLTVHSDGDQLVIRGPKSAASFAKQLIDRKPAVLAALAREAEPDFRPFVVNMETGAVTYLDDATCDEWIEGGAA